MVTEVRRAGMLSAEDAANLTEVPNIRQKGTRVTKKQVKELPDVPDRSSLKGKRNFVLLALLVGCSLRRQELA